MNAVTKKLVLLIGPTVIEAVLSSIINEEKLTSFRDALITFFRKTADSTVNEIDDYLAGFAIDTIMEPGRYVEHTQELCKILREYIQSSQTEWDDMAFLPILDRIELFGTTKEK